MRQPKPAVALCASRGLDGPPDRPYREPRMRFAYLVALVVAVMALALALEGNGAPPSGTGFSLGSPAQAEEPTRPNVLVIVTDDQRGPGTMGVMRKTRAWMERGGVRFTNAFVTTPFCCPSRATIFTGQVVHNHGVFHDMEREGESFDHRFTMQAYLRQAGYRTGIFGKYLNGWDLSEDPPYFDRWAVVSRPRTEGYSGAPWNVNGTTRTIDMYSTTYISQWASRFLRSSERADDRPWFLYLGTYAPHYPFEPEPKYADARVPGWHPNPAVLEEDRSDKPPYVRKRHTSLEDARRIRRQQLRTLMSVDDMVERAMRLLGRLHERRDTLVIFVSDNGYLWGEHGLRAKLVPYFPSINIPLLIRWPGRVPDGVRDGRAGTNADLLPTILDATMIEPDPGHQLDGTSLLDTWTRERLLTEFWSEAGIPSWASIRTSEYQYVEYYDGEEVTFREYYDLAADPWQLVNLLADGDPSNNPDVGSLSTRLALDRSCSGTEGPAACP
jgi:arylsulfatase A-like enzyme